MKNSVRVGAFALVALAVAAWFVLRIQHIRLGRHPGVDYVVVMSDADGLQEKAWVLFKGVRVGKVSKMELQDEGVRATVNMQTRIPLREGATARVLNVGLLGEKQLELLQGREGAPLLPNHAELKGFPSSSLDRVLKMAADVGEDVREVSSTVKNAVKGEEERNLRAVLDNMAVLTAEVRELVAANRAGVQDSVEGARAASKNIDEISESLLRTANILESLANRIEHGEGAVGKLVSDPGTGQKVDEALGAVADSANAVSDAVEGASSLQIGISLRADYLAARNGLRGVFGVNLAPSSAWMLTFQAVTQPPLTTAPNAVGVMGPVELPVSSSSQLYWTALLGYRFSAFRLRLGFIESTPGIMGELFLFADRLGLRAEVWEFSRADGVPHARLEAAVYPVRPIFLVGGWDDPLPGGVQSSAFIGAGLRFGP